MIPNSLCMLFNRYSNIFIQENAFENVICEMASILSRPQCVNTPGEENEIFWDNSVNTMAADALVPHIARLLATMVLNMQGELFLSFRL